MNIKQEIQNIFEDNISDEKLSKLMVLYASQKSQIVEVLEDMSKEVKVLPDRTILGDNDATDVKKGYMLALQDVKDAIQKISGGER